MVLRISEISACVGAGPLDLEIIIGCGRGGDNWWGILERETPFTIDEAEWPWSEIVLSCAKTFVDYQKVRW
jgi:hypothetical protein